ncbi:MAG: ABC transporter ATP-binding protein/permease, partial [Anaeroplasmataceae bacterium]|nr:ABC transporter ATP-binding protein/permease [Anaeroplasmataceae bacterium]
MLEVKNLRKEYKSKNGVTTKALDDVSLNFPEKGMIFILGKSGSGKSTLLNVCGGLDKADSGEIIIKGKSSKEFSGPDFDSYRNTYVGFVFQEYNVLDEFSVEENIGLALELQNKKRDKEIIDKILSDVDMTNFASRKPNTLSGGQKQRVAIARALVKDPQIIMADEPTGALDSKTGQQVFDTLKKLSKDKLVIVISHDRDFAEQYADRIIELKDGKVLSDQTRMEEAADAKNVRFFGTDTVCVSNGAEITDEDLQNIKKFLNRAGGSAVISTSRTHIAQMKEDRPEINVGSFENIKEQPKPKTYEQQKLIRSHLPAKHAVKMGANSLKSKPVRLVFTLFLSIIAFVLFGLASTLMLFDGKKTTVETFVDSDDPYIILSKGYYGKYVSYINDEIDYESKDYDKIESKYTLDEYKSLSTKYPGALAVGNLWGRIDSIRLPQYGEQYYTNQVRKAILVNDKVEMTYGVRPTAKDEIAISDFIYAGITLSKTRFYDSNNTEIKITKPEDLLYSETNKVMLNLDYKDYKVVGIYKLDTPSSEYDALKQAAENDIAYADQKLLEKWNNNIEESLLASVMVSEACLKDICYNSSSSISPDKYFKWAEGELRIWYNTSNDSWSGRIDYVSKFDGDKDLALYDFNGNPITKLSNNKVALHAYRVGSLYAGFYYDQIGKANNDEESQFSDYFESLMEDFDKENLLRDNNFNSVQFELDKENWEWNFKQAKESAEQNGEVFDETAYKNENPYPQKLDKYEWGDDYKYYPKNQEYYNKLDAYREEVRQTFGKFVTYKKIIYDARVTADKEFKKNNPEPIAPSGDATNEEWNEYYNLHDKWNQEYWNYVNQKEYEVNPLYKLSNLSQLDLTKEEILAIFKQVADLFDGLVDIEIGINNIYSTDFNSVDIQGMFFDNISEYCAYLSDDLYETYYITSNRDNYRYGYLTKYEEPEDAFIGSVYIPLEHTTSFIQELVDMTYVRAEDDSTAIILNSKMNQLSMFISLAETLGTVFLISGLVLALFAFLLMFNFISVSITAKKKEIGILRAIGARALDVYKIFMSESLIIAFICMVVSIVGTFGICMLLNSIITKETFIIVTIFSFGPLSALCIIGVALLT